MPELIRVRYDVGCTTQNDLITGTVQEIQMFTRASQPNGAPLRIRLRDGYIDEIDADGRPMRMPLTFAAYANAYRALRGPSDGS